MNDDKVADSDIDIVYASLNREAEAAGYHLNPDRDFTRGLIKSLITNDYRYGYRACPCRLASGDKKTDLDIICPCDYRDPDLIDYDACYCALYVSGAILNGEKQAVSIPERRIPPEDRKEKDSKIARAPLGVSVPVWRCRVCGYLCAREHPPEACPICKAKSERFELFLAP